ncbi:MAG: aminopeptidase, partial [Mycobacteriales bacterium]
AAYERRADTILHELAHMWFGDLVTMRWWDDLWLNESFASFVAVLCQSQATRWTAAWTTFANTEKTWAYKQDQLPSTHPVAADIPDLEAVEVNFDGITYAKGASVLKQLAAYAGIEAFLQGLRGYFRRYEYGNTTLADLLRALEEASGRDLSTWSAQWLERSGINAIRAEFTLDDEGRYTSFGLVQSAAPDQGVLRDHRLAIGLYGVEGDKLIRVDRIELDVTGARTEVPELLGVAQPDLLLVNDDDLTYCKVRLDDRSLRTVTDRIADLTDSLPRALCWSAAWDMTRDGEMAARDYLRLVHNGIGGEGDIGVLISLHRQALTALTQYADPGWAASGWQEFAGTAHQAVRAAAPGSDHQLAWMRAFASSARSAEHLALLRGVLDGTEVIDGLRVDAEMRWALLHALVATGLAGDDAIAAEAERDPTASGQRRAATARALRPTAAAKADAWWQATEDDDLPNATNEAIIRGFAHPAQEELLLPYVARYFEVVQEVWDRRSGELAQNVAVGLFPDVIAQSVVDTADTFLANPAVPPALRRLVAEGRAETARALHARARDHAAGTSD